MDYNPIAIEIFNDAAQKYQEKYMDQCRYHDTLDLFCKAIDASGAHILDVACGPGNISRYLLDQRPDFQLTGIDLSENMLELAAQNNPEARFLKIDARYIDLPEASFHGIVCGFGLPYLSREEAESFIQEASKLLREGGVLYLSTMEDKYEKSGFVGNSSGEGKQCYIYYHEAAYLLNALKINGFEIINAIRQEFPPVGGSTGVDLIIMAKKRTDL